MKAIRVASTCFHIIILLFIWCSDLQISEQEKYFESDIEVGSANPLSITGAEIQNSTSFKLVKFPLDFIHSLKGLIFSDTTFSIYRSNFLQFSIVKIFFVSLSALAP